MASPRTTRRLAWICVPVVLIGLLVLFWNWDWFIPIVQSRASAALGRPVKIEHLHVRLGRTVEVTATGVIVANPRDWPNSDDPPFASIKRLTVQANALGYIQGHGLVLPLISLDGPKIFVAETADGTANFRLPSGGGGGTPVKIGDLRITDGDAHVVIPKLKADFDAQIASQGDGNAATIVVDAKGTYAAQPITGHLVGGALLSLRDAENPWPINLTLANGPTHVALDGTLKDPVAFKGADVKLQFNGPDMGLLEPLLGFPIPKTPAYKIAGKLDLDGFDKIRFEDFQGRLGRSDIGGTIQIEPSGTEARGKSKPVVTMDLRSTQIDLADLSGFIGGTPNKSGASDVRRQQGTAPAKTDAAHKLLPDTPISIPRLDWADIHLHYVGAHIQGRTVPLDNLTVAMDVVESVIKVHPISFGVGKGKLVANLDLAPHSVKERGQNVPEKDVHARMDLQMQNLDVSRIMAATHAFEGAGSVSGVGAIDAVGNSLASLLAHGNGQVKMAMAGGNLSAILVDLTGLEFGNALLSALGVPRKTEVQCFVGDLGLQKGLLDFNALTLDTGEGITNVGGNINLAKETIDLIMKTDAKHFSIGSLPTRISIGGTFEHPSIRPGAEVAVRAGAVAGLAAVFAPLAILPTIQFGTSEADDARCGELLRQARADATGKRLPTPGQDAPAKPAAR